MSKSITAQSAFGVEGGKATKLRGMSKNIALASSHNKSPAKRRAPPIFSNWYPPGIQGCGGDGTTAYNIYLKPPAASYSSSASQISSLRGGEEADCLYCQVGGGGRNGFLKSAPHFLRPPLSRLMSPQGPFSEG